MTRLDPTAVTPTVARQTPKNEFGQVLNQTLQGVIRAGGGVLNAAAGVPVISAAVSSVTALANGTAQAQAAVTAVPGLSSAGGHAVGPSLANAGTSPANLGEYLGTMRSEADRSMMMQMQMQQESREYNTLTNILKLRHDSAKAAINNVR